MKIDNPSEDKKLFTSADYLKLPLMWVPCACCGNDDTIVAFKGDRYRFGIQTVVCRSCGLIYTDPRPIPRWFDEFYKYHYRRFYTGYDTPTEAYLHSSWIQERHRLNISRIDGYLAKTGEILDIGASEGSFLDFFRKSFPNWSLHGIEPNDHFAAFARSNFGIDLLVMAFEEFLEKNLQLALGRYDLVVTNHVLEHLLDPNELFHSAHNLLADDGLLFIDVPDAEGSIPGINNLHIGHVYHFSQQSLSNFLQKHGFRPLEFWRAGSPTWTIQVLARKQAKTPHIFVPGQIDAIEIAKRFRKYVNLPTSTKFHNFVTGIAKRGLRWARIKSKWKKPSGQTD